MRWRSWLGSSVLLLVLAGVAGGLTIWKQADLEAAEAAAANQPEPVETITAVTATEREHRRVATSIGTVLALRSITLRNELAGTVREAHLVPGEIVDAGAPLVALDVSVEEAELRAAEAQASFADTLLRRLERMQLNQAASEIEIDRARTERDVALAQIARAKAIIAKKTIRAPFKARIGLSDVHPGQYLDEGALLTTLQGVDEAAHVDFTVAQHVAAELRVGDAVEVLPGGAGVGEPATAATIAAIDARIDPSTRNATVRARLEGGERAPVPGPGSSVRVRVPVGRAAKVITIPASALRRGPGGDHVFVVVQDEQGKPRAELRTVQTASVLGDEALIVSGLAVGERVATSGSFKLRDGALLAVRDALSAHANAAE